MLCGAVPAYVNPEMNAKLGISLGMEIDQVARAIEDNPDAKAVLVNNPTYYGICSDLRAIVKLAHSRGIKVLTDEAHGTHLYFGENLPVCGMAAGADMSANSMGGQQARAGRPAPGAGPGGAGRKAPSFLPGKR